MWRASLPDSMIHEYTKLCLRLGGRMVSDQKPESVLEELSNGYRDLFHLDCIWVLMGNVKLGRCISWETETDKPLDLTESDQEAILRFLLAQDGLMTREDLLKGGFPLWVRLERYPFLDYLPVRGREGTVGALIVADRCRSLAEEERKLAVMLLSLVAEGIASQSGGGSLPVFQGDERSLAALQKQMVFCVHELKAPVAAVRQYLMILEQGIAGGMSQLQEGIVRKASLRARATLDLLDDWLIAARIDAGLYPQEVRPVNVAMLLRRSLEEEAKEAAARSVEITLREPVPAAVVRGNEELLGKALRYLLRNAIRFSAPGLDVQVEMRQVGEGTSITIADRGCGIPEHELSRVFEAFYRSRDPKLQDQVGAGMGLTVVRSVMGLHGGWVRLYRRPQGGVEAIVYLPSASGGNRAGSVPPPADSSDAGF